MSTPITRLDANARMSRVVIHGGIVYLSGLTSNADGIEAQTRDILAKIENYLAQAGTDKSRVLTAQIWLKDIARDFAAMNKVWDEWLPADAKSTRAAGQVQLAMPELLVEIIVTAALK